MLIRKTTIEEIPMLMEIYSRARAFMKASGNETQWGDNYPALSLITADVEAGNSYVCLHKDKIVGTFYFAVENDTSYGQIYNGAWKNEKEYAVVHRVAVDQKGLGVASFCLNWAYEQYPNVKIDTHKNNIAMQKTLEKNGFAYCGEIKLADGSERIAYQHCE
ncbi:MAG: GNAT family N-acetyltransferase [bacterium]|nr:GNAT family N-acetyltransferase [bacterium]